jgi:hypothetical protein
MTAFQKDKQIINLVARLIMSAGVVLLIHPPRTFARTVRLGNSMGTPAKMVASPKRVTNGD